KKRCSIRHGNNSRKMELGMGGVGKTTLLTQINNKFGEERFTVLDNIQDEVARKVGLGGEEWREKQKSQKTEEMYNF
ncbi:unnamed protein product, partial [Brassica oleracea]